MGKVGWAIGDLQETIAGVTPAVAGPRPVPAGMGEKCEDVVKPTPSHLWLLPPAGYKMCLGHDCCCTRMS